MHFRKVDALTASGRRIFRGAKWMRFPSLCCPPSRVRASEGKPCVACNPKQGGGDGHAGTRAWRGLRVSVPLPFRASVGPPADTQARLTKYLTAQLIVD